MRNLKRALSLTLASVMLLGMMVVGSSAAAGYDDVKETDNVEAIEVLQAVEIMVGDDRGFGTERPVNRAEMAVVMGKLLNLDYNYYSATCPFNDVYDWARGWVGACAANGIVSGRGAGVYDPGATVTAVEAASMLMRALGYFKYANDYADGFEVSTVRMGTTIGIFDGVGSSATEPMTRNQVAQMVLNALETGVVQPDGNTINLTTPDGSVYTGKVNYVNVTSNKSFATAIKSTRASSMGSFNDAPIVELGEQLYNGKLKLNDYTTDAFERPSRYWEYDGRAIGTYIKKELLKAEYTTEVTGKTLYDLLGKDIIADYQFAIAIDGEQSDVVLNGNTNGDKFFFDKNNLIRTNTKGIGGTGNGVLTQVFVDPDEETNAGRLGRGTVYIAVINTYLAKANNDYDAKKEQAEFEVWSLEQYATGELVKNVKNSKTGTGTAPARLIVKNEDINVENIKDKDIVLVHVAEQEIQEILDPEVIAETEISSFKEDKWVNNGTQYDYASSTSYDKDVLEDYYDSNMKDTLYNLYLDKYGYMIGIEIVESKTNYAFLTGIDGRTSNLRNKTAEGNLIFLDGTMETVSIKLSDSFYAYWEGTTTHGASTFANKADMTEKGGRHLNAVMNTWCTYTVNANGDYVLQEVANSGITFDRDNHLTNGKLAKAGQSHVEDVDKTHTTEASYTALSSDPFGMYYEINKKRVSTPAINKTNGYAKIDDSSYMKMAYGTDDTVYINVSTGLITADCSIGYEAGAGTRAPAIIIDDVNSVYTGVQNVNLKALSAAQVFNNTTGADVAFGVGSPQTVANLVAATAWSSNPANANTLASVSNGIYNLFDSDGALIAAIVVGEDNAASTGYAYIISDKMDREGYDKTTGNYTWTRQAVVNGEITYLTEVTDGLKQPDIQTMVRGQWYEVKYKADGTVKAGKSSLIAWDENEQDDNNQPATAAGEFWAKPGAPGIPNQSKFVGLVKKVEAAVKNNSNSTVVLATNLTGLKNTSADAITGNYYGINPDVRWKELGMLASGSNKITTTGNTLWIETKDHNQKDGFAVRNDAKVVLLQDTSTWQGGNRVKVNVMENKITYSQTGKEALAKMVKDLINNNNFSGYVSAVFEGGVATSVVIWDQTPETIQTGAAGSWTPPAGNYTVGTLYIVPAVGGVPVATATAYYNVPNGSQVPAPFVSGKTPAGYMIPVNVSSNMATHVIYWPYS